MRRWLPILLILALGTAGTLPAAEKELKVGFVYVSPIGDAGWSYAHDLGRQHIAALPGVQTAYVEAVPEGADAERVILNMARKNFDIIFATSFGYMDPMLKVAQQFPDTVFMHCSGFKLHQNMGNYFGRMYQARYLSGMVAGAMARKKILGYVAAFPIPEVIRGINAFTLGAQAVNPEVQVRVVWTKTWYDPATEKEAAKSLLDVGADVIAQHQDSPGPQEAAQEAGVYSIGYNSDMSQFAPKAHLVAPSGTGDPFTRKLSPRSVTGAGRASLTGTAWIKGWWPCRPCPTWFPRRFRTWCSPKRPKSSLERPRCLQGRSSDQTGTLRIPAGESATDEALLGMDWFVQGVVGTTE